ncbi:MAG: RNA polymerase sigma factor [Bryobacteraceae bacterium]|nr:RNA polymerase sigma factor [Bryobacteraceae bacterium]
MQDSDAAIVARTLGGDQDAFRLLVERYGRAVFRLAFRITGNESDAEDVVQEAFLRAYKQLHRYESRSAFGTWLYRIASNYALDLLRSRKRHDDQELVPEERAATDPAPDRLVYAGQLQERLDAVMAELSPQERTAFVLRHLEGQSIEEIGAVLGLGVSATKNSIFRAVQKLRRGLEPVVSAVRCI